MRKTCLFCLGLVMMVLVGCQSDPLPPASSIKTLPISESQPRAKLINEYRIGVDDVVQISVWGNEELSRSVPVRPDGKISMPLIGDVQAGGLTPQQVSGIIKSKLARFIRDPQVSVILTDLRSHEYLSRVRIAGAVQSPLSTPFRQGMTVLDLVLEAGGVTEFAAPNQSRLYRKGTKESGTREFNVLLGEILNRGNFQTNYPLQPGDVISVPERGF